MNIKIKARTAREAAHDADNNAVDTPQIPDPRPGAYYVSARDAKRYALLLGPFDNHADALAQVDAAKRKAYELDPRASFYAFGTLRLADDVNHPSGSLNKYFKPH